MIDTPLVIEITAICGRRPCDSAVAWLGRRRSLARAWADCPRGDWLVWVAEYGGADRRDLVAVVSDLAESVIHLAPADDPRPAAAIEAARAWARGTGTAVDAAVAADAAAAYVVALFAAAAVVDSSDGTACAAARATACAVATTANAAACAAAAGGAVVAIRDVDLAAHAAAEATALVGDTARRDQAAIVRRRWPVCPAKSKSSKEITP